MTMLESAQLSRPLPKSRTLVVRRFLLFGKNVGVPKCAELSAARPSPEKYMKLKAFSRRPAERLPKIAETAAEKKSAYTASSSCRTFCRKSYAFLGTACGRAEGREMKE
jgi:hypothetical protein